MRQDDSWLTLDRDAPVGLVELDGRGIVNRVNQRWLALCGVSALEVIGSSWLVAVHPDDRQRVHVRWNEALRAGTGFGEEFRLPHRDGAVVWVLGQTQPRRDQSGTIIGHTGSLTDITSWRQEDDALRESEARFRALASATAAAIWTIDASGDLLDSPRQRWPHLTDLPPDELASEWLAAVHPDDREPGDRRWWEGIAAGQPFRFTQRVRQRDGSYRHFEVRAAPVHAADGTVREWVGADIEITTQKRAELALVASEGRFRSLADAMPQVVWIADPEGNVTYYNSRVIQFHDSVSTGQDAWDWRPAIHPDDVDATEAAWQDAVASRAPYAHEHRIQMADGTYRWHLSRAHPVLDLSGEIETWYGTATDIDDLKQAEIALKEHRTRLQTGIDVAGFGLAEFDTVTGVGHFSREAAALFALGSDAVSVSLVRVLAVIHPDDRDAFAHLIQGASPEDDQPLECRVVLATGEVRWLNVRARLIGEAIEQRNGSTLVMAALDVTERRRADSDRQALLDAIAHDLRNPLTTWKFRLQLLQRQLARGVVAPDMLVNRLIGFERLADQMTDLLEELEELAEVTTRPIDLASRDTIDLVALMRDGIAGIEPGEATPPVALVTELPEIPCAWERTQVQRVVANLLRYALNRARAGSAISVRLARSGQVATIEVREEPASGEIDRQSELTMPVAEASAGGSAERGGGLVTVRTIVERHGGSLVVANGQTPGVLVRAFLPLGGPEFAAAAE